MKNNDDSNYTTILPWDKKYPKSIIIPEGYFTSTPDNVVYVTKCKKCKKEHKV